MRPIPYIDRLAQAQWFERFGFVTVAMIGCVAIIAGKLANLPSLVVTGGAVVTMIVYAAILWRSIAGRVRADQAGDNLYYLGLLYTLTGLAYAIFTFRPEASSNSIVEGFGIALATTILGLMLRVFFNQVRADLVEVEERARMDLSQAALELKSELNQITVEMNHFGRQTRQSLAEAVKGIEAGMINTIKEAGAGLAKLSAKTEKNVTTAFTRLEQSTLELGAKTEKASDAIGTNAAAAVDFGRALELASVQIRNFAEASGKARDIGSELAQQVEAARTTQTAMSSTSVALQAQVQQVSDLLSAMGTAIENSLSAQDERLKELQKAPTMAAEQVGRLLAELHERMQSELSKFAATNAEAIQAQLSALREAVSTLREHNGELAAELQKSRGYTTTVHSSLVSMVDELAVQVNGRAQ